MADMKLLGRVIITGEIETLTGLHIGGSPGALSIGNVDMPVIRNAVNGEPYIPGSSLKGKMRSLSEKLVGAPQNTIINKGKQDRNGVVTGEVRMHTAKSEKEYYQYWVNPIFGVTGDAGAFVNAPNRLIVRDISLAVKSRDELREARTDLPYTEVKWEAAIDRITSAATPRQTERVPAGAIFGPLELVFSVFLESDITLIDHVFTALKLVEDDYLGGQGSRGSGKILFRGLKVTVRGGKNYLSHSDARFENFNLSDLDDFKPQLLEWIRTALAG